MNPSSLYTHHELRTTSRISITWEIDAENEIVVGKVEYRSAADNTGVHWSAPIMFYVTAEKHVISIKSYAPESRLPTLTKAEANMLRAAAKTMFTATFDPTKNQTVIWGFSNNTAEMA